MYLAQVFGPHRPFMAFGNNQFIAYKEKGKYHFNKSNKFNGFKINA
jgi:hypothetical protein